MFVHCVFRERERERERGSIIVQRPFFLYRNTCNQEEQVFEHEIIVVIKWTFLTSAQLISVFVFAT